MSIPWVEWTERAEASLRRQSFPDNALRPFCLPYKKPPAVDVSILPQEVFLFQFPFFRVQFKAPYPFLLSLRQNIPLLQSRAVLNYPCICQSRREFGIAAPARCAPFPKQAHSTQAEYLAHRHYSLNRAFQRDGKVER